ncbi:hypothetical protein RRG08_008453 [Elysia crispata]|uniref:Uncharacterized protein n=1 Tax=Elysia crispata TaxID=231223 RepID=A0AAE1B305_9GAST|nr:hypothetical protein RRG08_008453 [Elysia crispata]
MEVPFAELTEASDPNLELLSKEELEEFQRVNNETISRLKADIELLKWKLKQFGPEAYLGHEYNSMFRHERLDVEVVKEKLQREIEQYTDRIKETIRLTGVTVDSFDRRVDMLDDDHCVKEFNMDCTVYNRRVRLSCTIDEYYSAANVAPVEGKVTWFQIQFQEDIHKAVGEDVLKAAEKIALHSAFSLLKTYLKWKKERDDIMVQLTQSNADRLSLFTSEDGVYCLKITNQNADRPIFTIEWGRKTLKGRIVPDVHLKVDAPEKWTAMDTENVLESAPEIFETMITTLGLEKALQAFVQLLMTDGKLPQTPQADDSEENAVS